MSSGRLRVLRILLSITETSAPYNQFSLPLVGRQDITVCAYFRTTINISKNIKLIQGDNTLSGFYRVLKNALVAHAYDVIHAHTPHVGFLFILTSIFTNPKLLSSTVYTIHSSYSNYKFRNRLMLAWVFLFFRKIVCCSHASYASFPPLFKWLAGHRLQVIPNGVDIARIDQSINQTQTSDKPKEFTIVTVGRLIELKRPHILLQAFHKSCELIVRLVYIGEGHLHQPLLAQSQQLGIEKRIIFTGLIPRDEVYQYLHNADLFVSTSGIEGLPVAVLEAMACRCLVILSNIPSHREIAEKGNTIPLVSLNDVEGFALEIDGIFQMTSEQRAYLGAINRELAKKFYNLNIMHHAYEQIYAQVVLGNEYAL